MNIYVAFGLALVGLIALVIFFFSWSVFGNGKIIEEEREISGVRGVDLAWRGSVRVVESGNGAVKVKTDGNIMPLVRTRLFGGILLIRPSHWLIFPTFLQITVPADVLESLSISGSGSIHCVGTKKGESVKLTISGSGEMAGTFDSNSLNISVLGSGKVKADGRTKHLGLSIIGSGGMLLNGFEAENVRASIPGSGSVTLGGKGDNISVFIAGSGSVKASHFEAQSAEVSITGSGGAEVDAEKSLSASIVGSGSVKYRGNPKLEQRISGSGSLSKIED
jgi:hypothetical protein